MEKAVKGFIRNEEDLFGLLKIILIPSVDTKKELTRVTGIFKKNDFDFGSIQKGGLENYYFTKYPFHLKRPPGLMLRIDNRIDSILSKDYVGKLKGSIISVTPGRPINEVWYKKEDLDKVLTIFKKIYNGLEDWSS